MLQRLPKLPIARTAILVVDIQSDFTELRHGPLPGKGTDQAYLNHVIETTSAFQCEGFPIFASQDWHPPEHASFFTNHPDKNPFEIITLHNKPQTLWPPHCVQGTKGAEILIPPKLITKVIHKGMRQHYDSYSAFHDDGGLATDLHASLKQRDIKHIVLYGLVTDYCVLATTLDARQLGYQVWILSALCRSISTETEYAAWQAMLQSGANII